METLQLTPEFEGLINPDTLIHHFEELQNTKEVNLKHSQLLHQFIEQLEPIDFEALAFPQTEDIRKELEGLPFENPRAKELLKELEKIKLNIKHYLIISIEHILEVAENKNWGLCKNKDYIYLFNGAYWAELEKEVFQKFLAEASERLGVSKYNARYFKFIQELFKQFLATAYLPTPETDIDKVQVNLLNGTFEITAEGTKLQPFNRTDFIRYQLPFHYNPTAKAPLFEAYLNKVLPDLERQNILAEFLGYVFMKHGNKILKEEKALILYGTGANGKSVFYEVVNALLGAENVSSYTLQSLTNESGYYRAMIGNKLVNYASEINGNLETSIFKQLVSGESVEARLPYGQPFMLKHYAKFIFNCNELPKNVELTNAYFRRFLIIPFEVTITDKEKDSSLPFKIINNELSGVFNWVLKGLQRVLAQGGFSDCEASTNAVEQYRIESDSLLSYLQEYSYTKSTAKYLTVTYLYPEYRRFCQDEGIVPYKKQHFIKQLKAKGFIVENVSQNKLAVYIENEEIKCLEND